MATIGQIKIGMSTDTRLLSKGLGESSTLIEDFGRKVEGVSGLAKGLFAGLAAGGAAVALKEMAGQAAHLQEGLNKVDAVFGGAAGGVAEQAKAMAGAFGISVTEMTDAAGRLGSMFRGAGFGESAAAEYTNTLTRLANDLSRFNDTSFETAFDKLRSGLSGESEPLRDFGVFLTEDLVKARGLQLGLADLSGELSEMAKMQARASLIMEQAGPAIGAAAREADGASAKMEALGGVWENLTTTVGERFAPIVGDAMGGLATAIQAMGGYWDAASASVSEWAGGTLKALGLAGEGFNVLEAAMGGLANAWQVLSIGWKALQGELVDGLRGVVSLLATAVEGFDSASEALSGWSTGLGSQLRTMADSMGDSVAEMRKSVVDEWAKPWASAAVSESFQKVREENERLRRELASKPMTLPVALKPVDGGALKDKVDSDLSKAEAAGGRDRPSPLVGALTRGSAEAVEATIRTKFGGGARDKVAENTGKTVDGIKEVVKAVRGLKVGGEQRTEPFPI